MSIKKLRDKSLKEKLASVYIDPKWRKKFKFKNEIYRISYAMNSLKSNHEKNDKK